MALVNKRIIDLPERAELNSDDYTVVDGSNGGTAKYKLSKMQEDITTVDQDVEQLSGTVTQHGQQLTTINQTVTQNTSDIADLKEDLDDLTADVSEIQSDGIVPTARQLLSDKYAVDQTPYKYRASYSGDRMNDEIVGGSIVWNQFANLRSRAMFGITVSRVNESTIRVTGTISGVDYGYLDNASGAMAFQATHVYIVWVNGPSSTSSYFKFYQGTRATPDILNSPRIFKYTGDSVGNCIETIATGDVDYTFHWNKIDLTVMFGADVADYIYNLEQANAGAGVAYFRKLFPNDYYEYDAGTLKHVEGVSSHDMVGFNQWDEEWEVGGIFSSTGEKVTRSDMIRSKNYIRVIGGNDYFIKSYGASACYDSNKNYISSTPYTTIPRVGYILNIPKNASYILFSMQTAYGTTYNHDICINISDPSRNGEYEPYVKHSYPLDSSLTLRGIPKLGDNGLYFDGDRYKADGTVERRYGVVDLGTLSWEYLANAFGGAFRAYLTQAVPNKIILLCEKYVNVNTSAEITNSDKVIYSRNNGVAIYIKDTAYTDTTTFKASLSGVMLVYELATLTTETAQPYQNPQIVDANGTEEYVSTSIVPIGHYTKYYDDLRKKLDGLPWNLDMIAPEETGTTASQAYAIGKYFILDNQLCKAKTAIASGATFTLNTNYEVTTVADELYAALHS